MENKRTVSIGILLKINLLLVCLFVYFPSSYACLDFTLHHKGNFILLFLLILEFVLVLLQKEKRGICLNRIDFLVLLVSFYIFVDFRSFNVEYWGKIIIVLLAYYVFRNVSIKNLYVCLAVIILSAFIQLMYCWFNFAYPWETLDDVEGIFHNTGIWGGFVAVCSVFVCGVGLFRVKRYRIMFLLLFVLLAWLAYVSASRAAWLTVVLSLFYFLYVKCERNIVYIVGLLVGFILFAVVCFPKMYYLKSKSAMGRAYIWEASLPIIEEHFLFGTGQGGFQVHYMEKQAAYLQKNILSQFAEIADETDNPFNEFIKIAVEYGILGLILFLILIYYAFCRKFNGTVDTIIFRGILWGMIVFAFFSYPFMYIQFRLLFVMCLAGISHSDAGNMVKTIRLANTKWMVTFFFLAACPVLKYYFCLRRWESCVHQERLAENERIEEMGVLYPTLKKNAAFLTYYAYLYSEKRDYVNSVSKWKESLNYKVSYKQCISLGRDLERMGEYDEAEAYWKMASFMIPSRFTPVYLQIEMAMKLKKYEKADSLITLFMMKKRKVDSPDLERMNENVVKWRNQLYRNG